MAYKRILCLGLAMALASAGMPGEVALAQGDYGQMDFSQERSAQEGDALVQEEIRSEENVVEDEAFQYRELEDGTLEVTGIKNTDAETVAIPEKVGDKTVSSIRSEVLANCTALKEISFPSGVTLWAGLFVDCSNLETITLAEDDPNYVFEDGALYDREKETLIFCSRKKSGEFEIPESVTRLQDVTFYGCKELNAVRIPSGLYDNTRSNFLGDCDALTKISVDHRNPYLSDIDGMLFDQAGYYLRICPAGLTDPVIPEGTTKICMFALCSSVRKTVTFPKSVNEIEGDLNEAWDHPVVMIVPEGSYAESYAKEYGIEYRYVDEPTDPEETGNIQGFDYKRQEDGSIEITGYTGSEKEVTVPSNLGGNQVSRIGNWAFREHNDITKVVLEEGIREIGSLAFAYSAGLAEVRLPNGLEKIGSGAFYNCTGLTQIVLPEGLESMYYDSFRGCASLREATLPWGMEILGTQEMSPFMECYSLESISIAANDPDFQCVDGVLYNKDLTKLLCCPAKKSGALQIPETVTLIASNGLQGCSGLTGVALPEGLTEIRDLAFDGCSGLEEIQLPDGLETIGDLAFRKCTSLRQVNLPEKVEGVSQKVFSLCTQMESVTVEEGNLHYTAQDGILYSKDMSRLLYIPAQIKGDYTVPQSVTDIAFDAADDAAFLESLRIHKGVQFDEYHSGWNTFRFCKSMVDIEIEEGHPIYYSKDGMVFAKKDGALVMCPAGRQNPVVPDGTEKVNIVAFVGMEVETGAYIPKETITFPASVSEIRGLSKEMVKLMVVDRESYAEDYAKEHEIPYRYADGTYPGQPGPDQPGPDQPGPDQPIEGQDFLYRELEDGTLEITGYQGEKTEVSIPSKLLVSSGEEERAVSGIGEKAFAGNYELEKIEIPQGVAYIGQEAFKNCISLAVVSRQGEALMAKEGAGFDAQEEAQGSHAIGKGAFQNCIRLTSVSLPEGVTEIGEMAFQGCGRLGEATLPDSLARVGREAFGGCESLGRLALPEGVTEIEEMAFKSCSLLEELLLPEGLKSIGRFAFVDCARLTELALPESLESIGYGAFQGCPSNLVLGVVPGSYGRAYAEKHNMAYQYTRACDHNYEAQIIKEATCTQEGERLYACTVCEEAYQEAIPALGHSYQTSVNKAEPKKDGSVIQQCSRCDSRMETKIASVKAMALAKAEYTYNGKAQSPKVTVTDSGNQKLQEGRDYTVSYPSGRKNPGSYTVTVRFCGNYSGTLQKTFRILPKGTSVSKVTAKQKGFTLKWKKQATQITGYEIQYSTSKSFTKKATVSILANKKAVSKSVSKLKAKKKYYIRIRTYKNVKVSGKSTKLCSGWSKAKSVTTKK